MANQTEQVQTKPRILQGEVVAVSGTNTIKVKVETKQRHPIYEKILATHKNYLVHADDAILSELGVEEMKDLVGREIEIIETKPYSKNKTWKAQTLVERN